MDSIVHKVDNDFAGRYNFTPPNYLLKALTTFGTNFKYV